MSDVQFTLAAEGGPDDLPRTLLREREARRRSQQASPPAPARDFGPGRVPETEPAFLQGGVRARVTHLEIPFFRLMFFFIKAVFAAVPALAILGAMLWLAGTALQAYYPELIKMQVLILFPHQ